MQDPSIQKQWVLALEKEVVSNPEKFSVREKDFISNCMRKIQTVGFLSDEQENWIEDLYAART